MTRNGCQIATEDKSANHCRYDDTHRSVGDRVIAPLRTSVGEFAFQPAQSGCYLEIIVGHVRRELGHYTTSEEAVHALKDRRTGFRAWDALRGKTAVTQASALKRWAKNTQTN
jgi:hypothetical protein